MAENKIKDHVLKFEYSYPYESTLLRLGKQDITSSHHKDGYEKAKIAQKIWNKHEAGIFDLFCKIYKITIPEKRIKVYISLIAPNSFSDPFTISFKLARGIKGSAKDQRGFIYSVIHELAHYFLYTRGDKEFGNKLYNKLQDKNILGNHGANLHYLVQAVEFGIIGEVFGLGYAEYARNWNIKNWGESEYGKSANLLKKHNVPLDRTCLEYINKKY